jgi:hypothetical protein
MSTVNRSEPNRFGPNSDAWIPKSNSECLALHPEKNTLAAFAVFTVAANLLTCQVEEIRPLMHGEGAHRGVKAAIGEREMLGVRIDGCPKVRRAPLTHSSRRLNGLDCSIGGLIRAGARPDIQHRARIAKRGIHERGYPRVSYAIIPVHSSD